MKIGELFQNHGGKIAIAMFGLTAIAAAILVPMTLVGQFKGTMQSWMTHQLGAVGQRWYWIAGGAGVATAIGIIGLAARKPAPTGNRPGFQPSFGDFDDVPTGPNVREVQLS